jgi:hypothetical protein
MSPVESAEYSILIERILMFKKLVTARAGVLCALVLVGAVAGSPPVAALPLVPLPVGGVSQEAKPVTLMLTPKLGETVRYRTTMNLSLGGTDVLVELGRKESVEEITDSKDIVLALESEGGSAQVNGETTTLPPDTPVSVTVNKNNRVLAYKPEREDNPYLSRASQHLMMLIDRIVLPEKSVLAGESWTTEVDHPQSKGKKVTIKTTFVGEEKKDGVSAWKVKQTLEADNGEADGKLKAEVTALLDAATGQLIEAQQTVKGLLGLQGPMDWTSTLKRVKSEDDAKADPKEKKPAAL